MDNVRRIPVSGIKCSVCGTPMQLVWVRRLEEVARKLSIGYDEKEGITHLWGNNSIAREVCEDLDTEEYSERLRCPYCGNEITDFKEYLETYPHLIYTDRGPLFTEPDPNGNYKRIDYPEKELLEKKKNCEETVEEKNDCEPSPDPRIITEIKCSECGDRMIHTTVSRQFDTSTALRSFIDNEGKVDYYYVEGTEDSEFIETEEDSDRLDCRCGKEIVGVRAIVDYINKHPECIEVEEEH